MASHSFATELETYQQANPRSAQRFAEAQAVLAGGNSRLTALFCPLSILCGPGGRDPC